MKLWAVILAISTLLPALAFAGGDTTVFGGKDGSPPPTFGR